MVIIGNKNVHFGWVWLLFGLLLGAVMGLWSFNGPFASPFGDYTSLPRRMIRLAHIAFIALGMINILYGYQIDKLVVKEKYKIIGSRCLVSGSVLMPIMLIGAAFFEPLKYFTAIPATLIIVSISIIAFGSWRSPK